MATKKVFPSWCDAKSKLADFDCAGLLELVHDLYDGSKDNQAFLHARLDLGDDVLKPYKAVIGRWLWPDVFKRQSVSIARARKAISDYKKAIGLPEGLAELKVFYCEQAARFSNEVGMDDEIYYSALVNMFELALGIISALPGKQRPPLWMRLGVVRRLSQKFSHGVGEDMDELFKLYGIDI
jgi:hypothetical protein